jgi:putative sterol carrier protein
MKARDYIHALPTRFNPEALPSARAVFHFIVSGEGGGKFTASIKNGACKVIDGLEGEPNCVVTTSDETLVDIVTGKASAQMAVFTGRLKISDLGEMMKFAKPFGLM